MLFLIGMIAVVYWIGTTWGDTAGEIALVVAVVIVLAMFIHAWIEDDRAWAHRVHYWAMDGKERAMARHRWEAQAREEERRERERRREKASRKKERALEKEVRDAELRKHRERIAEARNGEDVTVRTPNGPFERERDSGGTCGRTAGRERFVSETMAARSAPVRRPGSAAVCHYCGRYVQVHAKSIDTVTGRMREYRCPMCGTVNRTKLGA